MRCGELAVALVVLLRMFSSPSSVRLEKGLMPLELVCLPLPPSDDSLATTPLRLFALLPCNDPDRDSDSDGDSFGELELLLSSGLKPLLGDAGDCWEHIRWSAETDENTKGEPIVSRMRVTI